MEGGDKPTEKMFYQATETAYNPNPPPTLNGWRLILNTPTLDAWFDGQKSILVGVRGTNITDKKDLFADANIPLNRLTTTDRYKKDVADLRRVFADYPPERYEYYLAGHSLGGAIINQLKADFPMLKDAVQYNPAFQPLDFFRSQKGDIKRIYTSEDGLYKLGGRFFRNNVVIPSKIKTGTTPIDAVSGHLLSNFAKMYEGAGDLAVAFGGAFLPKMFYNELLPKDIKALKSDRDKYGWLYTKVKDFAHIFSNGNPEIEQSLAKALGLRVLGDDLWEYMGIRGFDADHQRANRYLATATINAILKAHPDAVDRKMAEYVANNPGKDLTRAEDREFVFNESVMKKYTPPKKAGKGGASGGAYLIGRRPDGRFTIFDPDRPNPATDPVFATFDEANRRLMNFMERQITNPGEYNARGEFNAYPMGIPGDTPTPAGRPAINEPVGMRPHLAVQQLLREGEKPAHPMDKYLADWVLKMGSETAKVPPKILSKKVGEGVSSRRGPLPRPAPRRRGDAIAQLGLEFGLTPNQIANLRQTQAEMNLPLETLRIIAQQFADERPRTEVGTGIVFGRPRRVAPAPPPPPPARPPLTASETAQAVLLRHNIPEDVRRIIADMIGDEHQLHFEPPALADRVPRAEGRALEQRSYETDEQFAQRQARVKDQEERLAKLPVVSKEEYFAPNTIAGRQLANSEPAKRLQTAGTYLTTLAWYKDPQVNANWEKAKKKRQADKFITALGKLGSLIIDSPIGDKYDPLGLFKTARGLILGSEEDQARDQMRQDTIDAKIEAFPKDKAYWISKEPAIREFEAKAKRDLEAWKDATYKKYVEEQTARQKKSQSAVGGVKGRKPTFEYSRPDLSESEKAKERAKFYRSKEYKEWKASEEEAPHPKTKAPAEEKKAPRGHPAGRPLEEEVQEANVPVLPPKEEEKKRVTFAYSREDLTKEEKARERAKFYREQKKKKTEAEVKAEAVAPPPKARRMVIVDEEEEAPAGVVGEAPADWLADLKERGWSVEKVYLADQIAFVNKGLTIASSWEFDKRFGASRRNGRLLVQPNLHEAWLLDEDATADKISTYKMQWTKLGVIYDNKGGIDFDYGDQWNPVFPKDKEGKEIKDAHFTLTYNKSDPKKFIVSAIAQTDTDPPSYYTGRSSWRWDWRLRHRRIEK